MSGIARRRTWAWVVLLCGMGIGRAAEAKDEAGFLAALPGEYVIVGREPDGGKAYAGSARIERLGREITVRRRIENGPESLLTGGLEPALGGDMQVLRLRSSGGAGDSGVDFTCLERGDLDNYIRLTCYWTTAADSSPNQPGLEALFPTGAWPERN